MSALKSTLGHILHPLVRSHPTSSSSTSSPPSPQPQSDDVDPLSPVQSESDSVAKKASRKFGFGSCTSKTASSGELFGILKALAAGGNDADMSDLEASDLEPTSSNADSVSSEATLHANEVRAKESESTETVDAHKKENLEKQMNEAMNTMRERDMLSSRFTALSMSNMSPLTSGVGQNTKAKKRPALPHSSSYQPDTEHDTIDLKEPALTVGASEPVLSETTIDEESAEDTPATSISEESKTYGADEVPDGVKIAAIVEEFGDAASLMLPNPGSKEPEPERMLAEAKGSLFKGVMMIGNLHLTTHRLLFHAQLPPESALLHSHQGDQASAEGASAAAPDVLMAGPVTLHRHGPLRTPRRLWMEVTSEMITTYPTGDEAGRVRPLQTVLLTSVQRMDPYDPDAPADFKVYYDDPHGRQEMFFSVDTEQSGVQWRRSLEAALFRHARRRWRENIARHAGRVDTEESGEDEWATMRCCVPLDRVDITGISEYHSFATLVGFDIDMDHQHVGWSPAEVIPGDYPGKIEDNDAKHKRKSLMPALQYMRTKSGELSRKSSHSKRAESPARNDKHSHHGKQVQHDGEPDEENHNLLDLATSPLPQEGDSSGPRTPRREGTQYIDTVLPPALAVAGQEDATMPTWRASMYNLNVAILNEQAWFAEALQSAVAAAHERKFKPDVTRPKMILEVAGYDCLATDEEIEMQFGKGTPRASTSSEEHEAHHEGDHEPRGWTKSMRKAEKASMAAKVFGLREDEGVYLKRCYVAHGLMPVRGHIIVTRQYICFWRRAAVGDDIKYRFPCSDIKGADTCTSIRHGFHGMALKVHGQHDLRFEFWSKSSRQEVMERIKSVCAARDSSSDSPALSPVSTTMSETTLGPRVSSPMQMEPSKTSSLGNKHAADILVPPKDSLFVSRAFPDEALSHMPFVANKPFESVSRLTARHFVCLTIGSRGDVQPYIALGLRLKQDGHRVTIVTHSEFKDWIEGYDIEHRQAGGDPTALMKLSSDHKMFSPGFFKESLGSFRQWLDDLLVDSWHACHDADVLIESPSTMSGIHIAEALKIPYFRAFTMPWTRTSAYPQAFMVPAFEMGPSFNYSTYVLFDSIMWRATAGQINRWRKKHLHIHSTDLDKLAITKVPFLYNFSPSVVPKPLDWEDDITITGYWNLENSDSDWSPPDDLERFMEKAKEDGKPLVYIGFGSIVVPHPNAMTRNIIAAVEKADVRAIIAKGWSSRGADPAAEGEDIKFPDSCYGVEKVPHGWLFPRINAAMHHGGAGTVGASLRAGIPTLIKPWFGDQFFWSLRVTKLEVGLKVPSLRTDDIAHALSKATKDQVMIEKAQRVGARIRAENGVESAMMAIHYNIGRAASDRTKM